MRTTALGLVRFLDDLTERFGPDVRGNVPLGVLEAEKKRNCGLGHSRTGKSPTPEHYSSAQSVEGSTPSQPDPLQRSEAATSEWEQASRSVRLLGGARHTSTAPAVPTAVRKQRAE
jgi:hypothetical protein